MQTSTLVRRFILIFLRYLFAGELSFTFCDFDTVAFLIISTAVTHRMLMLISQANLVVHGRVTLYQVRMIHSRS